MTVGPIGGLPPMPPINPADTATRSATEGFRDAFMRGVEQVSELENTANRLIEDVATGGSTPLHEMMIATAEATIATDMLLQIRDRALEAYHEVMRLQL